MKFLLSYKQLTSNGDVAWYVTKFEEFDTPGGALHRAGYLIQTGVSVHLQPVGDR